MFIVSSSVPQVFVSQRVQYCAGVVGVQLIDGVSVVEVIVLVVVQAEGNDMGCMDCAWLQIAILQE